MKSLSNLACLCTCSIFVILSVLVCVQGEAMQLDNSNFDDIIAKHELVFLNFYADWCRFSNMLAPIWDEAAQKVQENHPEPNKVVIAKVDCDKEVTLAQRFHITKYPTLKLLRNGQPAKREYRGQRSADAIATFIGEQLRDPITKIANLTQLSEIKDDKKRVVIGYFDEETTPDYLIFQKVATQLKDDCNFIAAIGKGVRAMHPPKQSLFAFKSSLTGEDEAYTGKTTDFEEFSIWATGRCIPIVREITFHNAEELTEEGLPFLILFHEPGDTASIRVYMEVIEKELMDEKQSINFLTADGLQFAHPLHHLGKSKSDLPLIAIDSFRHMYLFPKYEDIKTPGKLKQFVKDLHSGKLHREFHFGPDKATHEPEVISNDSDQPTAPPESTFKNLAPSKNRYTLLKDEL